MAVNYILDTNILLYDPEAIFQFSGDRVLIPIEVIEELEHFKHEASEAGRNSRRTAQLIDSLRSSGNLGEGVCLENGTVLQVVFPARANRKAAPLTAADSVLDLAKELCHDCETAIVTKNVNLRVKADALGIRAQDYAVDTIPDIDRYKGWHSLDVEGVLVEHLRQGLNVRISSFAACSNEYVFLRDRDDPKHAHTGKMSSNNEIVPLLDTTRTVCGIRGLNLEQTFTIDALLDENIKLVTLAGKAGTGKTLLAIAAGLQLVFGDDRYTRLLVFRPTMPVSRDLGYLPGDLDEKMRPWMQPVYDALDFIRSRDRKCPVRTLPPDVMDCEEISIEPLTYIRGRSIPNQFIIIDEAQNLTPLEVKTAITRVGSGSKVVLTGDPHQIDNPYVDSHSNGLSFLVSRFRESPLSAHVTLSKGERSELAETAANIL